MLKDGAPPGSGSLRFMDHAGLVTLIKGICSSQPLGCFKLLMVVPEHLEGLPENKVAAQAASLIEQG